LPPSGTPRTPLLRAMDAGETARLLLIAARQGRARFQRRPSSSGTPTSGCSSPYWFR